MRIILGSASPRRKELMEQLLNKYNIKFEIEPSDVSEEELKEKITKPDILVEELAYIKTKDIYDKHENEENLVVIGADTIVFFNGEFLGKPKDEVDAKSMLEKIQGNMNEVYTGMTVMIKQSNNVNIYKTHNNSKVYMKKMSDNDILEYVESKEPLGKAGSYAIQGIGYKYIEKYEGDYYTVIGLDINNLEKILIENEILKG